MLRGYFQFGRRSVGAPWGHADRKETRSPKLNGLHWLEMAGLSLHDDAVTRPGAHGKEGSTVRVR